MKFIVKTRYTGNYFEGDETILREKRRFNSLQPCIVKLFLFLKYNDNNKVAQ